MMIAAEILRAVLTGVKFTKRWSYRVSP